MYKLLYGMYASQTPAPLRDRPSPASLPWIIVAVATALDVAAFIVLRYGELSGAARLPIALLPLPGNLALLLLILRAIRKLDEFQQRIQLEAVTLGFLATAVAVFLYGYLQLARIAGPLHPWLVYLFLFAAYGIGYFAATRRYR